MLVNSSNITTVIPHRAPFIMIDTLEMANEERFIGTFHIKSDHLFLENKKLGEEALIESLAQTCAAGFGYLATTRDEKGNGLGFIGAVSKLKVDGSVLLNDSIKMEIKLLSSFDKIQLVEGLVYKKESIILSCQMKIVTP